MSTQDWRHFSACQDEDPERFFPISDSVADGATFFCRTLCDVRADCLGHAFEAGERFGVWGGLTEKQRVAARAAGMNAVEAIAHFDRTPVAPPPRQKSAPRRLADHHDEIVRRRTDGKQTWGQIAIAIGFSVSAVKHYGQRHLKAVTV